MSGAYSSRPLRHLPLLLLTAFGLSGCFLQDEIESADESPAEENLVSGSVGDGPITGAAIRLLRNDGELLAELESDTSANYSVTVKTRGKFYPLAVDANNGIDLVTGMAPDFALRSAVLDPGKKSTANLNPFTTAAIELAREMPGGATKNNVIAADQVITSTLGSGLTTIIENGAIQTAIDRTNVAEIVKSSETFGEAIRRVRDWLLIAGFSTDGDRALRGISSDLLDGAIDGAGGAAADRHVAALTNAVLIQVYLEAGGGELHVNDVDSMSSLEAAVRQIGYSNASPAIGEITITSQMTDAVSRGLDAAVVISQDPRLADLRDRAAGIRASMQPAVLRSLLPDDYRTTLDDFLMLLATADDQTIDQFNDAIQDPVAPADPPPTPEPNQPPVIQGAPPTTISAGEVYQFTPTASDPDGDTLSFSITNKPAWATFDAQSGTLSGLTDETNVGSHDDISISVSDGTATTALPAFSIVVESSFQNSPPGIQGTPATSILVGDNYSFVPTASDPDGDPLTFQISGRPPWLSFSTSTGELSGTPAAGDVGVHGSIVISVSDGTANTSLATFAIEVTAPATNGAPSISGTPPTQVDAGVLYRFVPNASDPEGDALLFSISGKPSWADFSTSTGRLSGTPASTDAGNYSNIVISVSDGSNVTSLAPFSIIVNGEETLGSVTLRWTAPSENTDGTSLLDLAGYRIYWGTTPGSYPNSVRLDNPGLTTYVVDNLSAGTYEFVITAINQAGVESDYSNSATKIVQVP